MPPRFSELYSGELEGVAAKLIRVEVDVHVGLHSFVIVGLADKAVAEAKERVNAAVLNSGFKPPNRENRKVTVSLAPASLRKTGSQYDLPVALGYLITTKQITVNVKERIVFVGELSLDGTLRTIRGGLCIADMARHEHIHTIIAPQENVAELRLLSGITVVPCTTLRDAVYFLETGIVKTRGEDPEHAPAQRHATITFEEIVGQEHAKRALLIATAGGHNMLMTGSPGIGKSMLAKTTPGILPALTEEERVEVMKVQSAHGEQGERNIGQPPFRSPHHTISDRALIGGGGNTMRPGEISLAHRGVLFLDELPEFSRSALAALRTPIETGMVTVARVKGAATLPARFMLIAAMNPCPCGFFADPVQSCTCSAHEVMRYREKVSGPLLDRIDIHVPLERVALERLAAETCEQTDHTQTGMTSAHAKNKVARARAIQQARSGTLNSDLTPKQLAVYIRLTPQARSLLASFERTAVSPRSFHRIIKIARTIADIEEHADIERSDLAEAWNYRLHEHASR